MARALKTARRPRKIKTKHGFSVSKYSQRKTLLTFFTPIMQIVWLVQAKHLRRDNVMRVTSHLAETRSSHVLNKQECLKRQSSLVNSFLLLLVFSVTPFKIGQNKNQNRLIDKVQNLGNERRYIYKDPRQDSGQRNISYTRYPKKCFTQTYRDLYGDAMLVVTWMSSNMADGNQQKHLLPSFATKAY